MVPPRPIPGRASKARSGDKEMHQQQYQHTADAPAPKPLWRGEYDRIYRLMAAKLRAAAEHRPAPEAAASAGDVP
jgi:hypothetical protein